MFPTCFPCLRSPRTRGESRPQRLQRCYAPIASRAGASLTTYGSERGRGCNAPGRLTSLAPKGFGAHSARAPATRTPASSWASSCLRRRGAARPGFGEGKVLLIVLLRCTDEVPDIACSVRDIADHLAELVDALAGDTGSRSIATGRDEQLEAARVTSHKPHSVSEADNDPGVIDASRSRARVGDLQPGKEGCQFALAPDERSLLPNEGVAPQPGEPAG
jgi:hypothetical protein